MEFTVFRDQENANNVLRNKENNVPPRDQQPSKRRSVLGVLNAKQPLTKKTQPKPKPQGTNKFGFPIKSSVPFTIHEDPQLNKKAAASENLSRNNVENQKPLLLKNETNISEAKATLPKIELLKERRKPLSDVSQIVAPSVKSEVKTDDTDIKDIDESANSSNVYSPMSIDNDKSIQSTCHSMTAHRLSCDVDTYTVELYSYLRDVEKLHRPKPGYMRRQPDVTYSMRAILVDWLVEVAQEYKLQNETLYLAVSFIDRFLSLMSVVRAKLQLLGTAAMFVASKYEEIYPPDVSEFVYITDDTYTKKQVLKMEQLILKVLGFDVSNPTTVIFLTHICVHCNVPLKVMYLAMYLGEMSLLEADPYLSYTPSIIGCGAVALARLILDYEVIWPENMAELTNYSLNDLIPILKHLNHTYKTAPHSQQSAIRSKYKSARYHSVSEIEYNDLIVPEETAQKEMAERLKLVDVQDKS
ncbi:cyclin-A2 [Acyrthosiphon pisum]|uniref:Cyclin A n=1 Tax=Acyrthosiphon pisum TaxID=7029 RepID=A0A8R1W004_ACYPI|nr:cyclin-A2 [Acyrthosiphon pisum]|eukprot:XP_001942828.2 PREDICTED: cyclin-A2 [Acyrthosiphon pisum]